MDHPVLEKNSSSEIFVARQAIFDRNLKVYAYELLFRSGSDNSAVFLDGNQATAHIIANTFIEFGLENITNNKFAFINLTRDFLTGKIPLPFSNEKVVLEVLEDIKADEESIEGLKNLVNEGHTIALDDFMVEDDNRDLIPFASIIKVDILPMNQQQLIEQVQELKQYPVMLLAEKVETEEEFELCKELGFDYFQGYFFSKPKIISGSQLPPNHATLLHILSKIYSPECDVSELEEVISLDVGISYKLLKVINSPYYGLSSKLTSIQHAIVVLGLNTIRNWITLISFSMVENKPDELIMLSLVRAKMCEELAPAIGCSKDSAFTVGLFSLLDVMLDQPLDKLVAELPLAEEVIQALLVSSGALGRLLDEVRLYEKGDWLASVSDLPDSVDMNKAYLTALEWSREITTTL